MGRGINRLTDRQARTTKRSMTCDGAGLWLRVKPAKGGGYSRSWLFRYALNDERKVMGIGSLQDRSLADARTKRDELRKLLLEGLDPKIDRDRRRAEQRLADPPVLPFRGGASECNAPAARAASAGAAAV